MSKWIRRGGRAPDQTTITFKCRPEVRDRLKALAARDQRSISGFMMLHLFEYSKEKLADKTEPWTLLRKDL